jgi:hypothetical protein
MPHCSQLCDQVFPHRAGWFSEFYEESRTWIATPLWFRQLRKPRATRSDSSELVPESPRRAAANRGLRPGNPLAQRIADPGGETVTMPYSTRMVRAVRREPGVPAGAEPRRGRVLTPPAVAHRGDQVPAMVRRETKSRSAISWLDKCLATSVVAENRHRAGAPAHGLPPMRLTRWSRSRPCVTLHGPVTGI